MARQKIKGAYRADDTDRTCTCGAAGASECTTEPSSYRPISAARRACIGSCRRPRLSQKSSVASTENVQPTLEMAVPRYPVDEITESEHVELHVRLMGLSIKVAVGYALPPVAGGTYHCRPIPDGYSIVGVDEVVKEYEEAQLDHATGEGETQLKIAVKTTII